MRRDALGVDNGALARALGRTRQAVLGLLRSGNPKLESLYRLEEILGVPKGWLLDPKTLGEIAAESASLPPPNWLRGEG